MTLTRQSGNEKVTVKFNVTNTINTNESNQDAGLDEAGQQQLGGEASQPASQLKSRPTFTVDITRGGPTLSFLCSFLPQDYSNIAKQYQGGENEEQQQGGNDAENEKLEDFQIDEFAIHDGEWNDSVYNTDCTVIDGELYDKLLDLLEEHGIGEGSYKRRIHF